MDDPIGIVALLELRQSATGAGQKFVWRASVVMHPKDGTVVFGVWTTAALIAGPMWVGNVPHASRGRAHVKNGLPGHKILQYSRLAVPQRSKRRQVESRRHLGLDVRMVARVPCPKQHPRKYPTEAPV